MSKILITGASGFIGRNLVGFLKNKGLNVHAFIHKKYLPVSSCPQICGDLRDVTSVEKALTDIDCVIHLASIINSNSKEIEEINVKGTQTLVDIARHKQVKKIIYLSTDNIFFDISNKYTQTKKIAEEIIKTFFNHTIIRPSLVYGRGEKLYFDKLIRIIQNWPIIPIIGNGTNKLQPLYVQDLSKCIYQIIKKDLMGVYTVAGGAPVTYNHLIDQLMHNLHIQKRKVHIPLWALYPFVVLYEKIYSNPLIDSARLKNFNIDKIHTISSSERIFELKFLPFSEGFQKFLNTIKI